MIIQVNTKVYIEVKDEDEAEQACSALGALDNVMRVNGFPHGDVIDADVESYDVLTEKEISELGFEE